MPPYPAWHTRAVAGRAFSVITTVGTPPCLDLTDEGAHMDAFTTGILQRIRHAETELDRARAQGDEFGVEVEQEELEDLRRLAADHGVEVAAGRQY
jgi:hypothetical protein